MGWTYAFRNPRNPRVLTSLTLLVLRQINPLHYIFFEKRGVNERLCIEEVGVDLEPLCSCPWTRCRTYRGSCSQKWLPLVISSSCIGGLIIHNRGSDHSFSLTPFPGQVKILVFCRSFHMSNLYFWSTSSIAPCYLKYIVSLHYHLWILIGMILHHIIPSLIGYIIIELILTVLSGPSSGAQLPTTSYAYVNLPRLIIPPWTTSSNPSLCRIRGSNSLHFIIPFAWCRCCSMASS